MPNSFSFLAAFDRNIGWLAEWEQQALRGKRVAIAGMGGVGGFHLLTLARLGVGAFTIADFDRFEIANFNRQVGASVPALGQPKIKVLADMALAINPEIRLREFAHGVRDDDVDAFLADADLFIDGFDFFAMGIRRKVFQRCAELGIPSITAAPIGMGVGLVAFTPGSMGFEEYFRLEGQSELRQYVNFLMGMAPSGIHRAYLVDPGRLDFARKKAPSTIAGVQLAASAAAAMAVKLLLNRDSVEAAPMHHHYDAYLNRFVQTRLKWGNAGPLQRFKAAAAERLFEGLSRLPARPEPTYPATMLEEIIHVARWTPSGDNAQPWRFRILGEDRLLVRIADHSADNIYEYAGGQPTLLSAGMLLASLEIAASGFGQTMRWRYAGKKGQTHEIEAQFAPGAKPDPLYSFLPLRSVDRRPYRLGKLGRGAKTLLTEALGSGLEITWHESLPARFGIARLNAAATDIRLRIPETYPVHKQIIDWRRRQSQTGIPSEALGLDKSSLAIMRWAMMSWPRMHRFNQLAGTLPGAIQMDYLPGIFCAAHFSVRRRPGQPPRPLEEQLLEDGAQLQRFWLTATRLGLVMQPSLAPLAFAWLGESGEPFTSHRRMQAAAGRLARQCARLLPGGARETLFLGRIGRPGKRRMPARSTRLSFDQLIEPGTE